MRALLLLLSASLLAPPPGSEGGLRSPARTAPGPAPGGRHERPGPAPHAASPFELEARTARALLDPRDRMGLVRALRSSNPATVAAALDLELAGAIRYSRQLLLYLRNHSRDGRVQARAAVLLLIRDDDEAARRAEDPGGGSP